MEDYDNHSFRSWIIYRWLLGHLRPYRLSMAVIICCGLVVAAGELVTPPMIKYLIDDIIPSQNRTGFFQMLGFLAVVFTFILLCSVIRNSLQSKVSTNAARDLQYNSLQHLRRLGFAYYEQNPTGETLSLLNRQVYSAEQIFRRFFPEIVQLTLFLTAAAGLLLYQSVMLSAIIIPCFLVYYLFGPKLDSKVSHVNQAMEETRTNFEKKVYDSVSGAREFRAFGAEEWDIGRVRGLFKKVISSTLTWVFYIHFRWSLRSSLFQIGTIAIFITGYFFIKWDWMSIGDFIAFFLIYSIFMFRLSWLISQIIEQNMLLIQVARLYELVHKIPTLVEPLNPVKLGRLEGALSIEDVHFGYPGRSPVLKGITLDVRSGERVAIVGTSGSGKSTLLKLINRFYDPTEGVIRLDGVPLQYLSFEELRSAVGYVFQDTYLFGKTIRENIRFGNPNAANDQIIEAAKAAYAHSFIVELSDGYDTMVGERGVKLSGGQKQRIAIARTFIKDPQILLMDEATSALDNVSENAVREAIKSLLIDRTIITVAHRLSTVMDYDRIIVLDGGVVAEQGSYNDLIAQRGLLYRLAEGEQTIWKGGEADVLS
jgi:ATP-binding cassette subfamily B protein